MKPARFYCLDEGFKGNDQLKANAVEIFKNVETVDGEKVVFRTV
jgi:adenine-specific DNA-methyltransferase